MDVVLDRDALYYPYIHITDVNWLKATLLSFPQVRRIVPRDFDLNDSEEVRPFRSGTGARGDPLLGDEPAEHFSAYQAQERLGLVSKQAERSPRSDAVVPVAVEVRGFDEHLRKVGVVDEDALRV